MRRTRTKERLKSMRKCSARNRSGKQCGRWAIPGGNVCVMHGGKAPQVKAAAEERLRDMIDEKRWREEVSALCFHRVTDVFDDDGNFKPVSEWPEDCKRALQRIDLVKRNIQAGDGQMDEVLKASFATKEKALEMAGKVLGMFKENVNISGGLEVRWKETEEE